MHHLVSSCLKCCLCRKSGASANADTEGFDSDGFDRQRAGGSSYTSPLHQRSSLSSSPTGSLSSYNDDQCDAAASKADVDAKLEVKSNESCAQPSAAESQAPVIVQVSGADAEASAAANATAEAPREKDLLTVQGETERTAGTFFILLYRTHFCKIFYPIIYIRVCQNHTSIVSESSSEEIHTFVKSEQQNSEQYNGGMDIEINRC